MDLGISYIHVKLTCWLINPLATLTWIWTMLIQIAMKTVCQIVGNLSILATWIKLQMGMAMVIT